jgi:hypothetical protein
MFIPTTAQQLGKEVYSHTEILVHVPAFFGHIQGSIRQRKHNTGLFCHGRAIAELNRIDDVRTG